MRLSAPLVGILVAVVLTVAFWFLLYQPANDDLAAIEAETATLEQQQDSLRNEIAQLRDIEARQVEIRAAEARLKEFIPDGVAQPAAIRQFQRAADAAGASIASVTFEEPTVPQATGEVPPADTGVPGTTLANIPIQMVVDGGYFQIVDFFRRLEVEVPRAVLVESLTIAEEADAGFPRLSATWDGQLFAVVDASELVDTDAGGTAPPAPGPTATPSPGATETPTPAGGES